jgi:hypothetical protein
MPAYPFGGHPTLADYTHWARQQGCQVDCGVTVIDNRSVRMTRIVAPSGRHVVEVGTNDDDVLVPTTVGRLDRRLGLDSPFAKITI